MTTIIVYQSFKVLVDCSVGVGGAMEHMRVTSFSRNIARNCSYASFVLYIVSLVLCTISKEDPYVGAIVGVICSLGLVLVMRIFLHTQKNHRYLLHRGKARRKEMKNEL